MLPRKNWISAGLGGLLLAGGGARAVELTAHSQTLLDDSMGFLDTIYDAKAGYLDYFYYPQAAGRHETRSSVWYATGLLQRNRGGDAAEAAKIIRNVVAGQATDPKDQWFGDYTVYPEQPTVGRGDYAPRIYNTWDPNWRGFIGTNLIVIYEEFGALLPADVRELIVASLYNATVGDGYRVGGVDDDNLYPSYSNPWIMRAFAAGWTGRRLGDANLTAAGEADARAFLDLFDRNGTLSEFNSPTYAGVSLYGLTLWAKYLPAADGSLMGAHGARLVRRVWETSARLYNANLRNLAGPWDRAYGYDMNLYVGIFNLYIWTLVGKDRAPVQPRPWAMAHADDFEYAPLIAVLAPFHDSLVPAETRAHFEGFVGGERLFVSFSSSSFSSPPFPLSFLFLFLSPPFLRSPSLKRKTPPSQIHIYVCLCHSNDIYSFGTGNRRLLTTPRPRPPQHHGLGRAASDHRSRVVRRGRRGRAGQEPVTVDAGGRAV